MNGPLDAGTIRTLRHELAELGIDELEVVLVGDVLCLHGVAPCYRAKREAVERAERLALGVAIQNEIRVAERAYIDDAEVSRDVLRRIARLGDKVPRRVSVEVRGAVVSLSGRVSCETERRRLLDAAAAVACVRGVEDHLMLQDLEPADTEVARALSEYVQRAMNLPPGVVNVAWSGGVAALTGSVSTAARRQAIEDLVLWHDHVTDVVNRIRIVPRPGVHDRISLVRPAGPPAP